MTKCAVDCCNNKATYRVSFGEMKGHIWLCEKCSDDYKQHEQARKELHISSVLSRSGDLTKEEKAAKEIKELRESIHRITVTKAYEEGINDAMQRVREVILKHKNCKECHIVDDGNNETYHEVSCLVMILKELDIRRSESMKTSKVTAVGGLEVVTPLEYPENEVSKLKSIGKITLV